MSDTYYTDCCCCDEPTLTLNGETSGIEFQYRHQWRVMCLACVDSYLDYRAKHGDDPEGYTVPATQIIDYAIDEIKFLSARK